MPPKPPDHAILIANGYCPLSFRSVDSIDHKKATYIFHMPSSRYSFSSLSLRLGSTSDPTPPANGRIRNARPANNKLNVFDLFALFCVSQGGSQRHTDEVTLRKLIDEGLLVSAQDGYKLPDRYDEIAKNVGAVEKDRKDDTINVHVDDTIKLSQLTERQYKIYETIKTARQMSR